VIRARLDRKTGTRLLCGGHNGRCREQLGVIYFTEAGKPYLGGNYRGGRRSALVSECPRCGEANLVDLAWFTQLRPRGEDQPTV
jgi:hypothetical protein